RGVLRRFIFADGQERRGADLLRIGVVDLVAEVVAAENDDEAVLAHGFDEHFDAGDLDRGQLVAHGDAALGGGAAGAAIGDQALVVHSAKIAANGDIALSDLKIDAEGFEDAAADAVFERIVTEQGEVAGTAAGRDAGQHGDRQAADAFAGAGVEV